jgi:RHS repeat-associated protein
VRQVTDASGVLKDTIGYDGYGKITSETASGWGGLYKWTGRQVDQETGYQYNRARFYDPKTGRWTSQDPLGFNAGDSNLYKYIRNAPTSGTDPSGLQAVAPGQFDRGRVSFSKYQKLSETQDIFAFKNPKNSTETPMSLVQLLAKLKKAPDFTKPLTLNQQIVTALKTLGYKAFFGALRFGLDVEVNATFDKGVDPDIYFWSQVVEETAGSTNAAFSRQFNLQSSAAKWDQGYAYPNVERGKNFLLMSDTPTYNVTFSVPPVEANGTWTFVWPKNMKAYQQFKQQFNTFKGNFEMRLTTQLRRFKPGESVAAFPVVQAAGVGALAPSNGIGGGLVGASTLNTLLDFVTEPVGVYTWGFKIAPDFSMTTIGPTWKRLK